MQNGEFPVQMISINPDEIVLINDCSTRVSNFFFITVNLGSPTKVVKSNFSDRIIIASIRIKTRSLDFQDNRVCKLFCVNDL